MKCRNIIRNEDGTYNIVWFKSYGTTIDESLAAEYGSFPITGRPLISPDEFPYMVCGFTDIDNNSTTCEFNLPRPTMQQFVLQIEAADGEEIKFTFYNADDPTEIFYTKTFIGSIDLTDRINTNSNTNKRIGFKIENSGILTIQKFYLKLSGISARKDAKNYVTEQEGVAKSLIQRFAVIKNELWYDINYGLPLFDKVRNKAIFDSVIIDIINSHEEVINIVEYTSDVTQSEHTYYFKAIINTIYNENIIISSEYPI